MDRHDGAWKLTQHKTKEKRERAMNGLDGTWHETKEKRDRTMNERDGTWWDMMGHERR
jgi:hypothetical protein